MIWKTNQMIKKDLAKILTGIVIGTTLIGNPKIAHAPELNPNYKAIFYKNLNN